MERGEPTLVPEWLRSVGGGSGVGGSGHPLTTSSHSDSSSSSRGRSRNSKNVTSFDSPRSAYLDRSSSSNSRRDSSNGSAKNAYSSFSRSHRDKDRDRAKDRLNFGADSWGLDSGYPLHSIITCRGDKDTLPRSHSMVTRMQGEVLSRKVAVDLMESSGHNHINGNGLIPGGILSKVVLEKDFPSLGTEERRQGVPDVVRVASPVLSTISQSSPTGSSSLLKGEGWTSSLIEVPTKIGSSSSSSLSGVQVASAAASGTSSALAGLNMAETLTQAPLRASAAPLLSVQTQRREELAIKQSRQLIPVTPLMPKSSVLNSSDKSKPKSLVRSGEVAMAVKTMQQQPSSTVNQPFLGSAKVDASKTSQSQGKLFVLKPGWENGVSPSPKDVSSPRNNVGRATNSQIATPSVPSAPPRSPNKKLSGECKPSTSSLMSVFSLEKKPSLSQTRSRNEFFDLLKKKSSTVASAAPPEQTSVASSPTSGKSTEPDKDVASAPASPKVVQECADNGDNYEEVQSFSEEETAFLLSLGWEENAGDEEGLTEEEIKSFYEECMKMKPSLSLCPGVQQRLLESHADSVNGVSSELISSDSGSEA